MLQELKKLRSRSTPEILRRIPDFPTTDMSPKDTFVEALQLRRRRRNYDAHTFFWEPQCLIKFVKIKYLQQAKRTVPNSSTPVTAEHV